MAHANRLAAPPRYACEVLAPRCVCVATYFAYMRQADFPVFVRVFISILHQASACAARLAGA